MKSERKSNIELLRIISILLIISFHYVYKEFDFSKFTINKFIVKIFYLFGELGVNSFFLITGYFMYKMKFSFKKIIKLILEVDFYFFITVFLSVKLKIFQVNTIDEFILLFFPTILDRYWFVTVYILLMLISPFLNILIENMTKLTYQKLLITILILWCVIPTFFGIFYNDSEVILYYSRFIWSIVMYFVGAYIKIYSLKIVSTRKKSIKLACISFGLMILTIYIFEKFPKFWNSLNLTESAYFWTPNNILMFLLSISIFSIFLKTNIKTNRVINRLATTTLGIYMFHEGLLKRYIFRKILKNQVYVNSNFFILHILLSTIIVFIVCATIDLIRQLIEKYTVNKFLDSKYAKILQDEIKDFGKKICKFI